ncbi:hypothetical protein [Bradyrhizobium sp. CB2312]|uniref:hypothetical protein n=1 Tax=Bradyrhizobium sp. CB2312 TaxID=3039155 RepID=UPI0024B13A7B|nr:hypothetical protein [Bradyrhizobium sp. CB2312]WFU74269.1 hypothetical protein QA642_09575 [Bradyrhizobium sp. CB2312]
MAVENGQFQMLAQVGPLALPDCTYLALISPVTSEGAERLYTPAFESISFLRAFISLSFGKLPFYTSIADFNFNAKGELSLAGEVVRRPLYGDVLRFWMLD